MADLFKAGGQIRIDASKIPDDVKAAARETQRLLDNNQPTMTVTVDFTGMSKNDIKESVNFYKKQIEELNNVSKKLNAKKNSGISKNDLLREYLDNASYDYEQLEHKGKEDAQKYLIAFQTAISHGLPVNKSGRENAKLYESLSDISGYLNPKDILPFNEQMSKTTAIIGAMEDKLSNVQKEIEHSVEVFKDAEKQKQQAVEDTTKKIAEEQKKQEELFKKSIEKAKELIEKDKDEDLNVSSDVMYHRRKNELYAKSRKADTLDRIGDGVGAGWTGQGSGIYLQSNSAEVRDDKHYYAVNMKKIRETSKLLELTTEEQATNVLTFLNLLQKYCMSLNGFDGYSEDLQGINPQILYNGFEDFFKEINMTYDEFLSFIEDMKIVAKKAGDLEIINDFGDVQYKDISSIKQEDSYTTRLLKSKGYEGVYLDPQTGYNNESQGSVIYDVQKILDNLIKFKDREELELFDEKVLKNGISVFEEYKQKATKTKDVVEQLNESIEEVDKKSTNKDSKIFDNVKTSAEDAKSSVEDLLSIIGQGSLLSTLPSVDNESSVLSGSQMPLSSSTIYEDSDGQLSFVEQIKKTVDLIEEESGQMSMFENVAEKATDSAIEGQMTLNDILNKNIEGQITLNDLVAKQDKAKDKKVKEKVPDGWIKNVDKAWDVAIKEDNDLTGKTLLNDYNGIYNSLLSKDDKTDGYKKQLEEFKRVIDEINATVPIKISDEKERKKLEELDIEAKELVADLSDIKKTGKYDLASKTDIDALSGKIFDTLHKNTAAPKEIRMQLEGLIIKLKELGLSKADIEKIRASFVSLNSQMKATGKTGDSLGTKIQKKFKDVAAYFATYVSIQDAIQVIRQGFETIKEYDTALTEMNKVSEESISTLKEFQKESFGLADAIGTIASALQNSTADWMRLGESLEEAKQSAQDANILFNVSEFETIDEATESLVAMSAAYDELEKIEIVDIMNQIGNNYAISTDELSRALQKSAGTLKVAGNDIYEAAALVTAGNAVLQDAESVGTGLKMISLRILGTEEAKEELASLGENVDDFVVQTKSKLDETIRNYTAVASNNFKGISVLDDNGNYKSTYEILRDISQVYQEILETDKKAGTNRGQALLEVLAGKNRSNVAASILNSPDLLTSVYESAQNAEGSAMRENEAYLESIEAHLAQLKNAWDALWINENNREVITFFLDLAKAILEAVDKFGVLNTLLVGGGGIFAAIKSIQGNGRPKCRVSKVNMPLVA